MRPGLTMISDTPTMPCRRTSSATRRCPRAARRPARSPGACRSTRRSACRRGARALERRHGLARARPRSRGLATPTVSAPRAAPLGHDGRGPLPCRRPCPPSRTRSAPGHLLDVGAALDRRRRPTAGSPPRRAPASARADVQAGAPPALPARACASVLTHQKSTPRTPAPTIRLTALQPPPHADHPDGQGRSSTAPPPAAALMTGDVRVRAEAELASGKIRYQDNENVPAVARRARDAAPAARRGARAGSFHISGRIAGSNKATQGLTTSQDARDPAYVASVQ